MLTTDSPIVANISHTAIITLGELTRKLKTSAGGSVCTFVSHCTSTAELFRFWECLKITLCLYKVYIEQKSLSEMEQNIHWQIFSGMPDHASTLYNDTTHDRNTNRYIYDQTSEGLISKVSSRVTPILSYVSEKDLKWKKNRSCSKTCFNCVCPNYPFRVDPFFCQSCTTGPPQDFSAHISIFMVPCKKSTIPAMWCFLWQKKMSGSVYTF